MSKINDRARQDRRSARRWSATERRKGGDRREEGHKAFARSLPEKFAEMHGTPRERVLHLVSEHCSGCDESLQVDLAQALIPILHTVVAHDRGVVGEEHRVACEMAVEDCVRRNEIATGRWAEDLAT